MDIKSIVNISGKDTLSKILVSLEKKGFYKFNSKLNYEAIKKTQDILLNYSTQNRQEVLTGFHRDAKNISNLHLKNSYFYNYIFNNFLLKICEKFFKNGAHKFDKNIFQLDMINSRILNKKAKEQKLHIDSRISGVYPPTQIQFLFYLNDVNKKNHGATQLVPGSHKAKSFPTQKDTKKAIQILGKKGNFFAINSSLWHGSSVKKNHDIRTLVTISYSRWNMRQSYAIPYGIKNDQKKKFSLKQKYILGYFNYPERSEKNRARMRGPLPNYEKNIKN